MHIKLRQPPTHGRSQIAFPVAGEVEYIRHPAASQQTLDDYLDKLEDDGHNVRRYIVWTDHKVAYTEIRLRTQRGEPLTVILTNWDAWLGNQFGATVDRVHRFEDPPVG